MNGLLLRIKEPVILEVGTSFFGAGFDRMGGLQGWNCATAPNAEGFLLM